MTSKLVLICLVAIVSTRAVATAQQAAAWQLDTPSIDRVVENYCTDYRLPGAAVVVTNGDQVLYAKGFGGDSTGQPISSTTLLPIASLSKSFTALAVMLLSEAGEIRLDDLVIRHLPELKMNDSRANQITIRQLLKHTSGMSDLAFPEKSVPTPASLRNAVELLRTAKLAAEPGKHRKYHNPNYWVAARLVEVVSGQEFARYLEEQIFVPLGMRNTFAIATTDELHGIAQGCIRLFAFPVFLPEPSWFLGGCGGVVTTADDMGRWLTFQNTGTTQSGDHLVSASGLEELHQGLGWNAYEQDGHSTFTHNGILFTFNARQYVVPGLANGLGVAVMANAGVGPTPLDADVIATQIIAIADGRSPGYSGPSNLWIDLILGMVCLIACCWGVLAWKRSARWAGAHCNRSTVYKVAWQLPYLIPLLLLAIYPEVMGRLAGGRDLSWIQSLYISPMLFVLTAVLATMGVAIVAARFAALRTSSANRSVQ